jgi:hypothetical protein
VILFKWLVQFLLALGVTSLFGLLTYFNTAATSNFNALVLIGLASIVPAMITASALGDAFLGLFVGGQIFQSDLVTLPLNHTKEYVLFDEYEP